MVTCISCAVKSVLATFEIHLVVTLLYCHGDGHTLPTGLPPVMCLSVFFNLFFEVEPFATILIAHETSCDDSCISIVT